MTPIERAMQAVIDRVIDAGGTIDWRPQDVTRAAIAAIEEPSEAMIRAGEDTLSFVQTDDARSVWRAMIKAALEEK